MPPPPPMTSADSVLEAYRQINLPATGRADAEHQWRSRLRMKTHRETHQRRAAAWETRNLRMAAHIREASARHPGKPVLVIVGSAHKPYLDAYLSMMSGMKVIQVADFLAAPAEHRAEGPGEKAQPAAGSAN